MAFPKKSGLRQITIEGTVYRWRASFGELQGNLSIYGPQSSGTILRIRSTEWFDVWLSWPYHNPKASLKVTPALVRASIEFGLANGWNPQQPGVAHVLEYGRGQFHQSAE